jgi:hypothetical protein
LPQREGVSSCLNMACLGSIANRALTSVEIQTDPLQMTNSVAEASSATPPGGRRCCRYTREICRLCRTTGPGSPPWRWLSFGLGSYRHRCLGWRLWWSLLYWSFAPKPQFFRHRRPALRIGWRRERMIASELPSPQVFISAQAVSGADMPPQCLAPITAIHAHDIIMMDRSANRYSRCENILGLNRLSEVAQCVMNCGDQVRKLVCSDRVMSYVASDDCRRQIWANLFGAHLRSLI